MAENDDSWMGGFIMCCQSLKGLQAARNAEFPCATRSHRYLTDSWWKLSPFPDRGTSFAHTSTVRQGAQSSTKKNKIQRERKRERGRGNISLCSLLRAYRVRQEGDSDSTGGRASPCAVSAFRPLGGNFWAAPSSVRRCIRKQRVKPTGRAQRVQYSSFWGKWNTATGCSDGQLWTTRLISHNSCTFICYELDNWSNT